MWNLDDALAVLRPLGPELLEAGWALGLTGSVLIDGQSDKDLDVIVYPLNSTEVSKSKLVAALEAQGWKRRSSVSATHRTWRNMGSEDCKQVEVWRAADGRRIDVFVLS